MDLTCIECLSFDIEHNFFLNRLNENFWLYSKKSSSLVKISFGKREKCLMKQVKPSFTNYQPRRAGQNFFKKFKNFRKVTFDPSIIFD